MLGALYLGGVMTGYPSAMSVRVMAAKEEVRSQRLILLLVI